MESHIEKNIDYLRGSQLFTDFSDNEIESFLYSTEFKIIELNRGDKMKVEIDKSIFVLSGSIGTYENSADGVKTFINYFEAEGNSMIAVNPDVFYPTLSIEARRKSVILLIKTASFYELNPRLLILQNKLQQNIIKIFYHMTDNIVKRRMANAETVSSKKIVKYLKQMITEQQSNVIKIPFTRQELADHLQMDISTLMRELKKLQDSNALKYKGQEITILNLD